MQTCGPIHSMLIICDLVEPDGEARFITQLHDNEAHWKRLLAEGAQPETFTERGEGVPFEG
jgi:hypothetical protein